MEVQLVYQPLPPDKNSDSFAQALKQVADQSGEIDIASPYLSSTVLHALTRDRSFRVVTDLDACLSGGVSQGLADFLGVHRRRIRTLTGLHAKVVLGSQCGFFGSANLTEAAVSHRFEMSCLIRGHLLDELRLWFSNLWECASEFPGEELHVKLAETRDRARADRNSGAPLPFTTGQLGWLGNTGADGQAAQNGLISEEVLEELAKRLRELTSERATAKRILSLLGDALSTTGLAVGDERLHVNCSRRGRISVTVGQRHVAWCRRKGRRRELGMMLSDFALAKRVASKIPDARQDAFTQNGMPVVPELYVPLETIDELDQVVLDDLARAIGRQVSSAGRSSYREKSTPALYYILLSERARDEAVRRAHPSGWWFGVNNGGRGHRNLNDIEPLFAGKTIWWPAGHSKATPKNAYAQMLPGDPVLVWTGHGRSPEWGLLGRARISSTGKDGVSLSDGIRFPAPLTPYPRGAPTTTDVSRFLFQTFGSGFEPLGDVRHALFGAGRARPITVAQVAEHQVQAVLDFAGTFEPKR